MAPSDEGGGARAAPASDARRAGIPLPLAFALLVALARLPVLIAHQDTWYPFEVHAGTIATAILDGLDLDVSRLPVVPHARGCVLFGLLLIPGYALLGPSAIAMKLLALVWHAATAAALVFLLERHHRRGAAIAAGVLLVGAPPMLAKLSTVPLASHLESMLIVLIALGACLSFVVARVPRSGFAFGLIVGIAGFFHLQALLPCLLLSGFALPALVRSGGKTFAAFLLGAVIGSAPSFLFAGGNVALLDASMQAGQAAREADDGDAGFNPPPLKKLANLATHDLAFALEFGEIAPRAGLWLGGGVAVLLALLAGVAAWNARGATAAWLRDLLRFRPAVFPLAAFFLAHAAMVVAFYLVSHVHHQDEIGAGLTNRHLAPVFFSGLALAAIGIGSLTESAVRAAVAAAVVALPGLVALGSIGRASAAQRLPQRGECYEWFQGQLGDSLREDPAALLLFIEARDRGEAEFRAWRFRLPSGPLRHDGHGARDGGLARELAAVDRGRKRSERSLSAANPKELAELRKRPVEELAAFHRGVGLGIPTPRIAGGRNPQEPFTRYVQLLLRVGTAQESEWIAEGFGFQLGAVFDPYNANSRARIGDLDFVPAPQRDALYRGLGWGARQRYLRPPTAVPHGLLLLDLVPPANRDAFVRAFSGVVRPSE